MAVQKTLLDRSVTPKSRVEASSESCGVSSASKTCIDHTSFDQQTLQEHDLIHLSRNVASNIVLALRPNVAADDLPASSSSAILNYEVLLEMDRTSGLKFNLEGVVTAIVQHFKHGSVE